MIVVRATPEHDAALRRLLRETPLDGAMAVTLEREPSFFERGAAHQDTILAMEGDRATGCGSRVVRRVWWNGEIADAAYLADLRVHPDYRKLAGVGLRRGYLLLNQIAAETPVSITWSAIFSSNSTALVALTNRRRSAIPEYIDRGALHCPLLWCRGDFAKSGCRRATTGDLPALTDFLKKHFAGKSLTPVFDDRTINPQDFVLLESGGKIVAAIAVRDTRATKQTRIVRLSWPLRLCRIFTRAVPAPGGILAIGYGGFMAVENDDPALLRRLLHGARAMAAERGLHFLCLCFHESDPRFAACKWFPNIRMDGRLFQIGRNDAWTSKIPQIEPAWL